jgi:hypothetical protein
MTLRLRSRRITVVALPDTYRTLCLAPTADFLAALDEVRQLLPTA